MKKLVLAVTTGAVLMVGGAFAADGGSIFTSKGCANCHKPAADTVGPSLKKIAQAYKGKKGDLVKFLKGEGKPHVDPAKFMMMKPQLNQLKGLSQADLEALADFILSH